MIGRSAGPGTVRKSLLGFARGQWVDGDEVVVALEREGSVGECGGMPVLSVLGEMDPEMMDFLVAAWCVTLWGEVEKRVRRLSRSSGEREGGGKERRFSFGRGVGKGKG